MSPRKRRLTPKEAYRLGQSEVVYTLNIVPNSEYACKKCGYQFGSQSTHLNGTTVRGIDVQPVRQKLTSVCPECKDSVTTPEGMVAAIVGDQGFCEIPRSWLV